MALDVVVCGGGVAGLEGVLALRSLAGEHVSLTLLEPRADFSPAALRVAVPFSGKPAPRYSLRRLADEHAVRLVHDELARVDADRSVAVTSAGAEIPFDRLLVGVGAVARPALPAALTFSNDRAAEVVGEVMAALASGEVSSAAFIAPAGTTWALPLYELALQTAARLDEMGVREGVDLTVVTPESRALGLFGVEAGDAVARILADAGIRVEVDAYAEPGEAGRVLIMPGHRLVEADRLFALPALEGPRVTGLPCDADGYLPIDHHGRVRGVAGVYAAGDGADFPIKHGGLAAQQADAVAQHISAEAGAGIDPAPFTPVLRAKLLTGHGDRFLLHEIGGGKTSRLSDRPLGAAEQKLDAPHLARWLAGRDAATHGVSAPGLELEIRLPLRPSPWRALGAHPPDGVADR
jgi:sulfide:quinone oxidoreductase